MISTGCGPACSRRKPGEFLTATIRVAGSRIRAELGSGGVLREESLGLKAEDSTFAEGKVALTADVPTKFSSVKVTASAEEMKRVEKRVAAKEKEEAKLQAVNPKPVVWKKFPIVEYGVGRNLRFGDLDGDGQIDILFGQVIHHGRKDRNSELSCVTAVNLDGKVLWQKGKPDLWKNHLTNDVGFQIHDIDGDGKNEAVYCMNQEIIVADGATGKVKYRKPTPLKPPGDHGEHNIFPRILGDSLFFCDLRGLGQDRDMIFKDRYRHIWAMNDQLEVMWTGKSEELFVLSPDVTEGGMYDGWGRRVVRFPADGHPYQCNAVLDATGDCRDEVVVWDPYELWVYTQDDNPKQGRLYRPERNGLYNYSNYQATVSLPGWAE